MEAKRELTFEETLAILAQVPKAEVDQLEIERTKRPPPKRQLRDQNKDDRPT